VDYFSCQSRFKIGIRQGQHWYLQIQLDMNVNGVDYKFDERIDANTRRSYRPLYLWSLQ
jgi:hypothetical protein